MALDGRETTQNGQEASIGCFQRKGPFYKPCYLGNSMGQTLEIKQGIAVDKGTLADESNEEFNNSKSAASTQCPQLVHTQNSFFWSAHQPNYPMEMPSHSPLLGSHLYPVSHDQYISMRNQFSCVPFQMHPQHYPQDSYMQDFHYFVVIDFEATCDKERNPHPQEIIEFPSVLVNSRTGKLEDSFQIYVRPTCNQMLTDFCRELTGIQQSQVDKGVILSEALLMHDNWLEEKGIKHTNFAVVTWSNWDCRVMLESECRFKRIRKPPYFNRWINLKVPFCEMFGGTRCNLKDAVQLAGLTWEGRPHCGLDDAKNTARLLTHLMNRGFKLAITNSLMWQTSDYTCTIQPILNPEFPLASYEHPFKWKNPYLAFFPFQPVQPQPQAEAQVQTESIKQEHYTYCHCGVMSMKRMVQKPGPNHGNFFFGCGKWTSARGACCHFFKWMVPESGKSI